MDLTNFFSYLEYFVRLRDQEKEMKTSSIVRMTKTNKTKLNAGKLFGKDLKSSTCQYTTDS